MLSIVIPLYKVRFFKHTLDSLVSQTNNNFKVYIGNDASPDDFTSLINEYKKLIDIEYRVFETNLGSISLVKQWERCIEMSKSEEWLMILGDDDKLEFNFVESFYKNLREVNTLKINVIRYASVKINETGDRLTEVYINSKIEKSTDFLMRRLKGETRSSLSEYIFRRSEYEKNGFKDFPLAWHSDLLAVLEFSNFNNVYTINNSLVYFRSSSFNISSMSNNLFEKNLASFKFYYYLIEKKSDFFDSEQLNFIYSKLEKSFLNNKKHIVFWNNFSKLYIKKFQFKRYVLFIASYFKSIKKSILD